MYVTERTCRNLFSQVPGLFYDFRRHQSLFLQDTVISALHRSPCPTHFSLEEVSPSASPKPGLAIYALLQHNLCKDICADFYLNTCICLKESTSNTTAAVNVRIPSFYSNPRHNQREMRKSVGAPYCRYPRGTMLHSVRRGVLAKSVPKHSGCQGLLAMAHSVTRAQRITSPIPLPTPCDGIRKPTFIFLAPFT